MRVGPSVLVAGVALCALGCFERQLRPLNPCTTSEVEQIIAIDTVDTVDLLFMVDNSGSMREEQDLLRAEIPRMTAILASGNRDDDPELEFTPVRSMHVGILTSDMGAGDPSPDDARSLGACTPGTGDDGILQNTSSGEGGCLSEYPGRVFDFQRDADDPGEFAAAVGCVADLGTGGCGFEQQLEATLKGLSPSAPTEFVSTSYAPPEFWGGSRGHGDGANAGFLRADSALAIIVLTDEEDCSVPNYEIFHPSEYGGIDEQPLNLRCSRFPEALHPVSRYVDGFFQLRSNRSLLIYAPIVGIPTDLVGQSYDTMLADPRLTEVEVDGPDSNDRPDQLMPSCDTENGTAFPPRRIIEVARGLEERGVSTTVQSICASSFGPAIDVVVAKIANALTGACLPRALNTNADGTVTCEVYEVLPAPSPTATVTSCAAAELELFATEVDPITGATREVCAVPQLPPDVGVTETQRGWYYDTASELVQRVCVDRVSPQRVAFSALMPPTGAEVRLSCSQAVLPTNTESVVQLGTFCTPFAPAGPDNLCESGSVPSLNGDHFSCDPVQRTCGVSCTSDADCSGAGLLGYVCDGRRVSEVVGEGRVPDVDGDGESNASDADARYGYCVNPTC